VSFAIPENPKRREQKVEVREEVLEELDKFVDFVQESEDDDAPRDLVVEGIIDQMLDRSARREYVAFRKWRRGELKEEEGDGAEEDGEDVSEASAENEEVEETGEFEAPEVGETEEPKDSSERSAAEATAASRRIER
jgi:hypothetical protein